MLIITIIQQITIFYRYNLCTFLFLLYIEDQENRSTLLFYHPDLGNVFIIRYKNMNIDKN